MAVDNNDADLEVSDTCVCNSLLSARCLTDGRRYFVECGLRNAESCQGVIYGKSSAERSANYPLSFFRIPLLKNSTFPRIAKLLFARIVPLMCSPSIATSASSILRCLPSIFFVVHLPKNRVVFFTISINFKVSSTFQVSHHFAGQYDWLQFV